MPNYRIFLKVIALVLVLALNFLFYPKAEAAARLTNAKDILSRLKISEAANHTISFKATEAIANADTIVLTFAAGFVLTSIEEDDVDIAGSTEGELTTAANCDATDNASVVVSGQTITFTLCTGDNGDFEANETVTIEIGLHATASGTGTHQITNPGTTGLKTIKIEAKTGATVDQDAFTAVFILTDDQVVLQATVEPLLAFTIQGGMNSGTEPTAIDFGTLEPNAYHKLLGAQCAYGSINISTYGNLNELDTVTVRDQVYTFYDTQAEADDDVKYVYIAQTAAQAAANLSRAINNNDAANVAANIDPTTTSKVWVMATVCGTGGNAYTLATNDATAITVSGATFSGGQAGSNYKDANLGFGEIDGTDVANNAWGTNLRISTNAANGYAITIRDVGFLSGGNEIADWSGTYGFGVYASAQSARYGDGTADIIAASYKKTAATPGTLSTSAATLASYTGTAAGDNIAIEYNVRISVDQAAGRYNDTLTYIATSTY